MTDVAPAPHVASFGEARRVLELYAEAIAERHVELRPTEDLRGHGFRVVRSMTGR